MKIGHMRSISAAALGFAVFGTVVFFASVHTEVTLSGGMQAAFAIGSIAAGFWVLMFTALLIVNGWAARQARLVTTSYGIRKTADDKHLVRHEVALPNASGREASLETCMNFLRSDLGARELRIASGGTRVTAKVGPFASFYFSTQFSVEWGTDGRTRLTAETHRVCGFPVVDTGGIAVLVMVINWTKGSPLSCRSWPSLQWKEVVVSAAASRRSIERSVK